MTPADPRDDRLDRLFRLLPGHLRALDLEAGGALQALLRVVAEQVNLIEDDIAALYEDWFIETCRPWVVPYLGEVVGYAPVVEAGDLPPDEDRAARRARLMAPRREAASALDFRRRKGTLAALEAVARVATSGWSARAVELRDLATVAAHSAYSRPGRGRAVDLRDGDALDRGLGPFSELARAFDARRPASARTPGRGDASSVVLYVWRHRAARLDRVEARAITGDLDDSCRHAPHIHAYVLDPVGGNAPLLTRPLEGFDALRPSGERHLPVPIRRRALGDRLADYYGPGKSLMLWMRPAPAPGTPPPTEPGPDDGEAVAIRRVVAADLSRWSCRLKPDQIAVDPVLGRVSVKASKTRARPTIWATFHQSAAAEIGGGDYDRALARPARTTRYVVRRHRDGDDAEDSKDPYLDAKTYPGYRLEDRLFASLLEALRAWRAEGRPSLLDQRTKRVTETRENEGPEAAAALRAAFDRTPPALLVEILDDAQHAVDRIEVGPGEPLEIRAGQGRRARLCFGELDGPGEHVAPAEGAAGGPLTLDGLIVSGPGLTVKGPLAGLTLRHCTLVPGLSRDASGRPEHANRPSLTLGDLGGPLVVDRCILGPISVHQEVRRGDPPRFTIRDSILDNAGGRCEAIGSPGCAVAFASLDLARTTIFGPVRVHAVDLAEDSLFADPIIVARRQRGCVRFSFVPRGSVTPRRYRCQPESAEAVEPASPEVVPLFLSRRFGHPEYAQLDPVACPLVIRQGAGDESEMGAFHDLYGPQRAAGLRARVEEFLPAGSEARIEFVTFPEPDEAP